MSNITGTARVRVVVEVDTSSWGQNCTVAQILRQASEEGVANVRRMVTDGGGRIIGTPEVITSIGTWKS